ncbi:PREDICTED: uncharacterized protein LOC109238212 [Nicotiana attenuata]|uniref:uncharacterized protein LOC109238212 n=1 Tax=Nicotiana attenuata TaxID=49451 RepID=UPI0009052537|nr:PREDICTED: uncharacterized protein LOC109238212 [Nicotiana attenuata]
MTGTKTPADVIASGSSNNGPNHDTNHPYSYILQMHLLLNLLSKNIGDSVLYSKSAKELWGSLEHRFGQSNGAKLYHLQKKIERSVQGNNNIAGYFTTLKKLWDDLALNSHLGCTCDYVCEGKKKQAKFIEDQRIIQFLMGLNDAYGQASGNILMMNPLIIMDVAYSLLLRDEGQKEGYINPQYSSDDSSFMVGAQTTSPRGMHHKHMETLNKSSS